MYGAADKSLFAEVELMIAVQLIVYLLVFTLMVKIAVRDNALNGIYFYPREVQKRAVEIGLIDEITIRKKRKHFIYGIGHPISNRRTYRQCFFLK